MIELTAAAGADQQAEGHADRREAADASSPAATALPEASREPAPAREQEGPSGSYFRAFALAKLVLVSAIASVWYYAHGCTDCHNESPRSADPKSKTRSP